MHPARILVVDDEQDVRELVSRILRAAGHHVEEAQGGSEAIERMRAARPDLLVLDLNMPAMDGWAVLDWLARSENPPPVVILTVQDDRESFTRAVGKGAVAYLAKPFRFGDVLATCQRVLQTTARTPPVVAHERRHEPRRLLMAAVAVYSREKHPMALGELVELSATGARIELGVPLAAGSQVQLAFHGRGLSVTLEGRVCWSQPVEQDRTAHGLEFLHLHSEQERLVRELLSLPAPE